MTQTVNWRKIVAREWLILMGCAIVGLVLAAIAQEEEVGRVIVVIYAFVQAMRATIWAIKTIRRPLGRRD